MCNYWDTGNIAQLVEYWKDIHNYLHTGSKYKIS